MDRRTLLAVMLSLTLYYTWLAVRGPALAPTDAPPVDPAAPAPAAPAPGAAAAPTIHAPARELPFGACSLQGTLATDGGGLRGVTLPQEEGPYDIAPIYRWLVELPFGGDPAWHPYGERVLPEPLASDAAHALVAGTGNPATSKRQFEVVRADPDHVELRSVGGDGVEVRQAMRVEPGSDPCTLRLDVTWTHHGAAALGPGDLWVGMFDAIEPPSGMFAMYENREQAFARVAADLEYGAWDEPEEGQVHVPERLEGTADWLALADRYHGLFALPDDRTGTAAMARYGSGEDAQNGVIWSPAAGLEPGATATASLRVYAGAHDTEVLARVDPTLPEIVDFGMFAVFAYPLLFLLQFLEGWTGNWGLAIVALTVFVRAAFFPLNQSAFKSAEKMKLVQPMLNEIRERYKDDQEEMNRRTFEVFKEHKVNPVGGCLPMLIQMPVFLALFYVLMYSADLYHTEFLYLRDLSSPDPYAVLPTIVVALMFVQQQLTPMGNMDPAQQRLMKIMPLMFGFFWYMFPSGLVVYYFVNTGLGILQQWWIRRTFANPAPVPAA